LGFLGLAPERPRLVVSGINTGPNMGSDITYSGTVSAAMEGVVSGVPAIAVSLGDYLDWDFAYAAAFSARLALRVLREGLDSDVLLNVNVPRGRRSDIRGVQVTRLGRREYNDQLIRRKDPYGRDYFWIGGSPPGGAGEPGTDLHAVAAGYVSVTPVQLDLTNHELIDHIASWRLRT
jgi:5'-nucleotidase